MNVKVPFSSSSRVGFGKYNAHNVQFAGAFIVDFMWRGVDFAFPMNGYMGANVSTSSRHITLLPTAQAQY